MTSTETATRPTEPETPLARLLREQGRKQKWLQQVIGCGKTRIGLLVSGERQLTLREAALVAKALGVPIETFLGEKTEGVA